MDDTAPLPDSLDLSKPNDRALFSRAIRARWPVTETRKVQYLAQLDNVIRASENPREICSAVKCLIAAEGQNQRDEHLADTNDRLDAGKPSAIVHSVSLDYDLAANDLADLLSARSEPSTS